MRRITIITTIVIQLATVAGCMRGPHPKPDVRTSIHGLPDSDPAIQQMIRRLAEPRSRQAYLSAIADAAEAKDRGRFSDETWVAQVLVFVSKKTDTDAAVTEAALVAFSQLYLQVDARNTVAVLVPFMDAPDSHVALLARDMLGNLGVFTISRNFGNRLEARGFDVLSGYLKERVGTPGFWALVRTMYIEEPDVALNTAARTYLTREQQQLAFQERKELTILLYSLDVATDEQKPELQRRVLAKLAEMTQHPHWCVRGYAMQLTLVEGKADLWSLDLTIPQRLSTDPNPFVSGLAKYIVESAQEKEQKEKLLNPATAPAGQR